MLIQFIQQKNEDILLLNETHLFKISTLKIPNFHDFFINLISVAGNRSFVSTDIFVRKNLTYLPLILTHDQIRKYNYLHQNFTLKRRTDGCMKMTQQSSVYFDLETLLVTPAHPIVAGDLNSKH